MLLHAKPVTFLAFTQVALALAFVAELLRCTFANVMFSQGAAAEQFSATPSFPLTVPDTSEKLRSSNSSVLVSQ